MFFATDLDRTLIYSGRFLEEAKDDYISVETYDNKEISYISKDALEKLTMLNEKMPVVPITTRNLGQYSRIRVFQNFIHPETYSVNNGGTIIHKGEEDLVWKNIIQTQIDSLSLTYEEAIKIFLEQYKAPINKYYQSDGLIWVVIGERDNIDDEALENIRRALEPKGWDVPVNGRKMYMLPRFINKLAAANYIKEKYYTGPIIAAGDSQFDECMVYGAEYGIIPKGAYIDVDDETKGYTTTMYGLDAATEIIEYASSIFDQYEQIG